MRHHNCLVTVLIYLLHDRVLISSSQLTVFEQQLHPFLPPAILLTPFRQTQKNYRTDNKQELTIVNGFPNTVRPGLVTHPPPSLTALHYLHQLQLQVVLSNFVILYFVSSTNLFFLQII